MKPKLLLLLCVICISFSAFVSSEYTDGTYGKEVLIYNFDDCPTCQALNSVWAGMNGTWFNGGPNYVSSDCAPIAGNTGCVNFSADSDAGIQVSNTSVFFSRNNWSLSVWMKVYSYVDRGGVMFVHETDLEIYPSASDGGRTIISLDCGALKSYSLRSLTRDWVNYGLSYNDDYDNFTIYINGTQAASWSDCTGNDLGYGNGFNILGGGWNKATGVQSLIGLMDDFVLFNKTLTQLEFMQLFNDSYPSTDTVAPVLTNPICTSCYALNYSADATPTINVTCTDAPECLEVRISNDSTLSYTTMTSSRNCTSTPTNIWICTLPESDKIPNGGNIYFTASDTLGNSHATYNLSMNIIQAKYLSGNVTDSNYKLISNATIFVTANNSNTILYNTTSNAEGNWNQTVLPGMYTVCGYAPKNQSLRGDCLPFIEVT